MHAAFVQELSSGQSSLDVSVHASRTVRDHGVQNGALPHDGDRPGRRRGSGGTLGAVVCNGSVTGAVTVTGEGGPAGGGVSDAAASVAAAPVVSVAAAPV
eukprot:6205533-Pleurochrysis_carterae.AAC.2